jgi:hypothetical protein
MSKKSSRTLPKFVRGLAIEEAVRSCEVEKRKASKRLWISLPWAWRSVR